MCLNSSALIKRGINHSSVETLPFVCSRCEWCNKFLVDQTGVQLVLWNFVGSYFDFDEPLDCFVGADIIVVTSESQGTRVSRRGRSW